jgi:hypothetical protein
VGEYQSSRLAAHWGCSFLLYSQPVAAVWTLTALVLGIRHRAPRPRLLATRPGFVGCAAAATMMLVFGPLRLATSKLSWAPGIPPLALARVYFDQAVTFEGGECGAAVLGAWMALALGGRWRSRAGAIDRVGFAIGLYWVAMILVTRLKTLM